MNKQTETETMKDKETGTLGERWERGNKRDRWTDIQTIRKTDIKTIRQKDRHTDHKKDRHKDHKTERQTHRP